MQIGLVTLFPELFETFLSTSLVGRATANGALLVSVEQLRDHGLGKHLSVDDTPYGGGAGMLLRVDCLVGAMENLDRRLGTGRSHRVLLTPHGQPFKQSKAIAWSQKPALSLICGRYEGFDERVRDYVDEEVCLGDFILIGGEVAAMAMIEACARLLPGVLGNHASATEESFSEAQKGGLEYPQFTRPAEFRGVAVPEVLTNGHHAQIAEWRLRQAEQRTRARRPELVITSGDEDKEQP